VGLKKIWGGGGWRNGWASGIKEREVGERKLGPLFAIAPTGPLSSKNQASRRVEEKKGHRCVFVRPKLPTVPTGKQGREWKEKKKVHSEVIKKSSKIDLGQEVVWRGGSCTMKLEKKGKKKTIEGLLPRKLKKYESFW